LAESADTSAAPVAAPAVARTAGYAGAAIQHQEDAPPCSTCGSIMIRSGSCYKCANCGTTSGCA
jgi:ribonucleoside-diphosphate reductase alpha chain